MLLGRSSVSPFVRPSVRHIFGAKYNFRIVHATVLKIFKWIPHEKKIADMYFFSKELCPFPELWPFEKNTDAILSAKYLKIYQLEP